MGFPTELNPEVQEALRGHLAAPMNRLTFSNDEVELHTVTDIDPVESYNSNKVNMTSTSEAYDDDDDGGRGGMAGPGGLSVSKCELTTNVQCKQIGACLYSVI